jgi:hypothetical protein
MDRQYRSLTTQIWDPLAQAHEGDDHLSPDRKSSRGSAARSGAPSVNLGIETDDAIEIAEKIDV